MVTAAVYWDLYLKLSFLLFILQHRAGVRPYTSSFDLAESCVFVKQSLPPVLWHLKLINSKHSFSRSYRVNLPSSFNIIISYTLIFSIYLPVSVYSTVITNNIINITGLRSFYTLYLLIICFNSYFLKILFCHFFNGLFLLNFNSIPINFRFYIFFYFNLRDRLTQLNTF